MRWAGVEAIPMRKSKTDKPTEPTPEQQPMDDGPELDLSDAASPEEIAELEAAFSEASFPEDAAVLEDDMAALIEAVERERDEALAARQRALADYANFQRRSLENEKRARQDGRAEVIHSLRI